MVNMTTSNKHIESIEPIETPMSLRKRIVLSDSDAAFINQSRETIRKIIYKEDQRVMVVVGPCSIHDPVAALDYAKRLVKMQENLPHLFLVMRVYFEKPRTNIGWKGLVNDPDMDGSCNISKGLGIARKLFSDITKLRIPIASEVLDPMTPQFYSDYISWGAIGARTTESQTHREVASGLSFPVGFKNATDGDLQVAIDAIKTSRTGHSFLGLNAYGELSTVTTFGNPDLHVVLRGGKDKPNNDRDSIAKVEKQLKENGFPLSLMVDCSHKNCLGNPEIQVNVLNDVGDQIEEGNDSITSVMIESNIKAGKQKPPTKEKKVLEYGVSVTDGCVSVDTTEAMLTKFDKKVAAKGTKKQDQVHAIEAWM